MFSTLPHIKVWELVNVWSQWDNLITIVFFAPLPPFTDKIFSEKGVTDLGGTPPPFTDKIRKVVFDVALKCNPELVLV